MARNLDGSTISFPQDEQLSFNEERHEYTHISGVNLVPVSRIYRRFFKPFDSQLWAERAVNRARYNGDMSMTVERVLDEWECKGQLASFSGTHLHKQIELFFNGMTEEMTNFSHFSYNGSQVKLERDIDITVEMDYFSQFFRDEILARNSLHPFRTEWKIFDLALRMAGTIDLLCRRDDGSFEIFDWKRSKALIDCRGNEITKPRFGKFGINGLEHIPDSAYYHYALQQNIYRYIIEKNYGLHVAAMHLVVLYPANKTYHVIHLPKCDKELGIIAAKISQEL